MSGRRHPSYPASSDSRLSDWTHRDFPPRRFNMAHSNAKSVRLVTVLAAAIAVASSAYPPPKDQP